MSLIPRGIVYYTNMAACHLLGPKSDSSEVVSLHLSFVFCNQIQALASDPLAPECTSFLTAGVDSPLLPLTQSAQCSVTV